MKTTTRLLMAAALGIVLPAAASAQGTPAPAPAPAASMSTTGSNKMDIGKWTGSITPPQAGGQTLSVEIQVAAAGDSVHADFNIPDAQITAPITNIRMEEKKLSFGFQVMDSDIKCMLDKKDDGSFSGNCTDQGGVGAPMTIMPPKKGGWFF